MFEIKQYEESAGYIRGKLGARRPQVLMVLGSGLGFLGGLMGDPVEIPYSEVPHFRSSTAPGHNGRFLAGELSGKQVLMMDGRLHGYEGYEAEETAYPVRVARLLGAGSLLTTNAAGAINREYRVGQLMLISDHIKLFDPTPLRGPNVDRFGPRFCDMTYAYTPEYREIAGEEAKKLDMPLNEGVYMYFPGPQFETPAEIRAARVLGADACGMSTVFEVIAAAHCGMKVLGFSLITNMAAGVTGERLSGVDVLEAAMREKDRFSRLVLACLGRMEG